MIPEASKLLFVSGLRQDSNETFAGSREAGGLPGDQIPRAKDEIYKARVANSDLQRGKSGGYRVIYSVETPTQRVLVTVYSKTEQADVTMEELRRIIKEVDREV